LDNSDFMLEWDTERNGSVSPMMSKGSHRQVWWICSNGHRWQARVYTRNSGCGCPYCSGRLASQEHNLLKCHPEIAKQWHPTKNGILTPNTTTRGSKLKVWWKCEKGHEWKAHVYSRTSTGCGCPVCAEGFRVSRIEMRIFTELKSLIGGVVRGKKIVGRECDIFLQHHSVAIEFDGNYWHKGREAKDICKNDQLSRVGILVIRVRQAPLVRTSKYDVMILRSDSEWKVMDQIVRRLQSVLWLDMSKYLDEKRFINDDEYNQMVSMMMLPLKGKSLGDTYPKSISIWHKSKNRDLTPYMVSSHSHLKIWWQCEKGHEWQAVVHNISKGKDCPYCVGQKASVENSLKFLFPDIARQWCYRRNNLTPDLVTKSSGRKVWWVCDKGHEWDEVIKNRVKQKTGCPYCSGRRSLSGRGLGRSINGRDTQISG